MHIAFLHPGLTFSGQTERLLASARVARSLGAEVSVVTGTGSRLPLLEAEGFAMVQAELPRSPLGEAFAWWRTRKVLRELKPDLLHGTDELVAPLTTSAGASLDLPHVIEIARPLSASLPPAGLLLKGVILPYESYAVSAVNRGDVPREMLKVIPHGPDISHALQLRPEGQTTIGFLGHLDRDHGGEVFVEAARRLKASGRDLRYLILGEGPEELRLRRKIRKLDLSSCFTVAAPTILDLAMVYSQLDVHVSSPLRGGACWLACQALGYGIPSIISGASESTALVDDRQTGLIAERRDPAKLAEAITILIDNPEAARMMGERAREKMLEARQHELFASKLTQVYESALQALV